MPRPYEVSRELNADCARPAFTASAIHRGYRIWTHVGPELNRSTCRGNHTVNSSCVQAPIGGGPNPLCSVLGFCSRSATRPHEKELSTSSQSYSRLMCNMLSPKGTLRSPLYVIYLIWLLHNLVKARFDLFRYLNEYCLCRAHLPLGHPPCRPVVGHSTSTAQGVGPAAGHHSITV